METPGYIQKLDSTIGRMSRNIRILYIESDYPDVLDTVLDEKLGSINLRHWLGITGMKSFQQAMTLHYARPLATVYSGSNGFGILKDSEYYRKEYASDQISNPLTLVLDPSGQTQSVNYQSPNGECIRFSVNWTQADPRKLFPGKTIDLNRKSDQRYVVGEKSCLNFQLGPAKAADCQVITNSSCRFFYIRHADTLNETTLAQMLRAFLESSYYPKARLVLTGTTRSIPHTLSDQIQLVRLGVPSFEDVREQLTERLQEQCTGKLPFSPLELDGFTGILKGLTPVQLDNVYTALGENMLEDLKMDKGRLSRAVWRQKRLESQKDNTLVIEKIEKNPGVVGNGGIIQWLNESLPDLADPSNAKMLGITPPRGLILAGVPGTGKTQLAKQIAYLWNRYDGKDQRPVSFIEFKIGNLSSSGYGESEAKMDHFLARISEQAPALLFIDEVEKTFYKNENSQDMHEVKKSQMALLLSWLQEHQENIFTVMTSNDISILPPELIRSGRLSERFFVFLPSYTELMCMLYSFLRDKAELNLFSEKFREEIRNTCQLLDDYSSRYGTDDSTDQALNRMLEQAVCKSSLGDVLVRLTKYAMNPEGDAIRKKELSGEKRLWSQWLEEDHIPMRTLFLTGADLGELVKNTLLRLRRSKKSAMGKWTAGDFAEAMEACCCRPEFTPYGQSNLKKCAQLYLSCDYRNVSAQPLLPRAQFDVRRGTFNLGSDGYIRTTSPGNLYDQYLQQTLRREIEKTASRDRKEEEYKDRQHRMAESQEPFQQEQMDFQREQMDHQRKQWAEEQQDKATRKQHEKNTYELTKIQLEKIKNP